MVIEVSYGAFGTPCLLSIASQDGRSDQTMWRKVQDLMHSASHSWQTDVAWGQPHEPNFPQTTARLMSDSIGGLDQRHAVCCVLPHDTRIWAPASRPQSGSLGSERRGLQGIAQKPTCRRRPEWESARSAVPNEEWTWFSIVPTEATGPRPDRVPTRVQARLPPHPDLCRGPKHDPSFFRTSRVLTQSFEANFPE